MSGGLFKLGFRGDGAEETDGTLRVEVEVIHLPAVNATGPEEQFGGDPQGDGLFAVDDAAHGVLDVCLIL